LSDISAFRDCGEELQCHKIMADHDAPPSLSSSSVKTGA